jgi:(1->4)-alpha-D-glucan 1-alpha-D-glucosylmutase
MSQPSIPSATYRLQFHKDFTFASAAALAPYLRDLGISHVYASPFFQASPGSTHGYDVTDHNALNPEVGSRQDFDAYIQALHSNGLSQIVDFVPNHMGIGPLNPYWMDVLENGQGSRYAAFFDIDWHPLKEELAGKVLLPILGDQYGRVLENGDLKLNFDHGTFYLTYFETRLPVNPRSYAPILGKALDLATLPAEDEGATEARSIITAATHLPHRDETDPARVLERAREKEIIKKRIERLCADHPSIAAAIESALKFYNGTKSQGHTFDPLDLLICEQAYRLSFWRVAAEEINYRRFFDINNLAAIKMELPEVLDTTHQLLFELIKSGAVNGVRIDHVDGLWNPREYLEHLQDKYKSLTSAEGNSPLYLLVEKILMSGEKLCPQWPVHGTTGYDFTNQVIELLVDHSAARALTDTYQRFIAATPRFSDLVYQKKQLVMQLSLASEVHVLGHMLNRLSEQNRWYRDFTLTALTTAVREVIACFPVYRTYAEPGHDLSDFDKQVIDRAVRAARRRNPGMEASIFRFLREILMLQFPENIDEPARAKHVRFVMKFQQCTGPITAKGIEDTTFYIYNRFAALNEVGGEPDHLGATPDLFHKQNAARLAEFPHSMLATSTHDTKRSEDVRARLAAISELPDTWRKAVHRFRTANRKHKQDIDGEQAPDPNEEYLIYQTLAGAWPLDGQITTDFITRIQDYMTKAIKEAKVNSSWIQPNENWDKAVRDFIAAILTANGQRAFPALFRPLAEELAHLGAINSLSQQLIKLTVPGVPDVYQGTELWNLSLVDPDNRRPVDYEAHRQALASLGDSNPADLLTNWKDGRIKLYLTSKLLQYRRDNFDLFAKGDYIPIQSTGPFADSAFAFARRHNNQTLLVIAPRLTRQISTPPIGAAWQDTHLDFTPPHPLQDLFTARPYSPLLSESLTTLPFAAFITSPPS